MMPPTVTCSKPIMCSSPSISGVTIRISTSPPATVCPWKRGVPALAVLDAQGKLLYSQRNSEFASMRRMDSASVTEFLQRWKG